MTGTLVETITVGDAAHTIGLITMREAATRAGLTYHALARLNAQSRGPDVAARIGYARLYRVSDVDTWAARKAAAAA